MSSFSSVVQKPGKKIVPKVAPRRNVPRKITSHTTSTAVSAPDVDAHSEQNQTQDVQPTQPERSEVDAEPVAQETRNSIHDLPANTTSQSEDGGQNLAVELVTRHSGTPSARGSTPELQQSAAQEIGSEADNNAEGEVLKSTGVLISAPIVDPRSEQVANTAIPEGNVGQDPTESNTVGVGATGSSGPPRTQKQSMIHTDTPSNPRKRRKITPNAASAGTLTRESPPSQTIELSQLSPAVQPQGDTEVLPADDLLASATRRAATVSELANSIESQTRLLRPQTGQNVGIPEDMVGASNSLNPSPASQSKPRRRKKTVAEEAAEVVANAVGKSTDSRHQRAGTPDGAETYELEPAKITMGQLCEDRKLGKKSSLETEMQANWPEILQRRKEDRERALANAEKNRRKGFGHRLHIPAASEDVAALAPAMAVVNGVIVVDQASREIDRSAQLQQAAIQDIDHVREDRNYYKYVNSGTVGIKPGQGQHAKWDEESTERFFKGLRMFGTDFLMIANMFPGLSRRQIKTKFIREENADKTRVLECLRNREPVQLEDYAQMASKEAEDFYSLESIQKELDAQEKRLRDEDNQRRKREGFVPTETEGETAQPTEQGTGDGNGRQTESIEPGRFDEEAREIMEAAVAPKRKQRKTSSTTNSKRGPKGGRRPEGGIEEILGNIDEVAV